MISGIILARNEASNIVECIKSLRPHVTEILLIDMESEDDTIELATPIVDKILHHNLVANFDCARNIAIPETANQWLWFVDADERLSDEIGQLINRLVSEQGNDFEAINIPFKTHFCGKWMEHSGWWPGYTMPRVLKKGHFQFSERLHGGVECSGREIRIPPDPNLGIEHFSYLSIEHYLEKLNRYTSTEAAQLQQGNQSIDWRNGVAHMIHDLWMYYERNRGDLDGRHGWILAWLSGQYRWLSHAKLLDKAPDSNEVPEALIPNSIDEVLDLMYQELECLRKSSVILPFGVVFNSPIWDLSGYADEGRCIAKALGTGVRPVVLNVNNWNDSRCQLRDSDRTLLTVLTNGKRQKSNISITNCIPTLANPDKSAAINVLRTTFETDRIPCQWLQHLDRFDEIWVISKHNVDSFVRSGVAPEKIRRVPSFLDTEIYRPDGPRLPFPEILNDQFIFLAVFDWQLRKGWDLLLKAYCQAFDPNSTVRLLLKVSSAAAMPLEAMFDQAEQVLKSIGQSLNDRTDIVFQDDPYSTQEMASLYRSVDVFVLPSRGEGWGRPYMEAMACGLPVIGTHASGNVDFMNPENSLLIPSHLVDVPAAAVHEVPVYEGHQWFEPEIKSLAQAMQTSYLDQELRDRLSARALEHIRLHHDLAAGAKYLGEAIDDVEQPFKPVQIDEVQPEQLKLCWEGEFFAGHSFSNINEQIAKRFVKDKRFAVCLDRKIHNPTTDPINGELGAYLQQVSEETADVVVRHAFPPNWTQPKAARWIHIQPWEYGHLPKDWIEPLKNDVDEIWAPTRYVKQVYVDSGIPEEKIFVIPWGVDPNVFSPTVPNRILPTSKSFKFLFVGGTIKRKGFDRVLNAYLEEFGPEDDVCLVVKDLGVDTFYRFGNLSEAIQAARDDPNMPEIIYYNENWTPGQVASLYCACDCLVMPYRGEGFGLPILESMACGTPAIVPRGGASDEFVTDATALLINSTLTPTEHEWELVGPALELDVSHLELRKKMRHAFDHPTEIERIGQLAAQRVAENFTWEASYLKMCERIHAQTDSKEVHSGSDGQGVVTACVRTLNNESTLGNCLARLVPFVDDVLVFDYGSSDRTVDIAEEYQARVVDGKKDKKADEELLNNSVSTNWHFWISPDQLMDETDAIGIVPLLQAQPPIASEVAMQALDLSREERFEVRHFRGKKVQA